MKRFDWKLSLAIDRALANKEKATTALARTFWAWRLRQIEKQIPMKRA
jgi:hypothetical protein